MGGALDREAPHLPHQVPIESYGGGGFRFAGMSHRGSLLCLPDGIRASRVAAFDDIDESALDLVLSSEPAVELCVIGTGRGFWHPPPALRARFRERGIGLEAMTTGAAVRTYNILLGESRRVAALLIALD